MKLVRSDADLLDELANRINRNNPGRTQSHERFFEEKDDVVVTLRRKARELRGQVRREASTTWRAPNAR